MAFPIQTGYKFRFDHKKIDNHYSMASAESYKDYYSVGYRISGGRLITTPGKAVVTLPGTVQFVHKDLYHRTTYISEDTCENYYEGFNLKFRVAFAEDIIRVIGKENFDNMFSQICITLTETAQLEILQIMSKIEHEWNNYDNYSESIIEGLVIQFFVTVLRGQTLSVEPRNILSPRHMALVDAIHYLEQHFAEDPSLESTASAIHISSAHLSRLFTSELQTSYSRFLSEIKLEHAMRLLISTKLPITEVAAQSGYQNSNYFCDAFKKVIGLSPLKFRKAKVGSANSSSETIPPATIPPAT